MHHTMCSGAISLASIYVYDESIWRKLCNDELCILFSTSNIRRKKIRLASMGSRKMTLRGKRRRIWEDNIKIDVKNVRYENVC